ncbi:MAG: hypothetical protein JXB49_02435 [Bacteroidales bacterium]|nr:hypothetical protein [Bacteroidales bacterium]
MFAKDVCDLMEIKNPSAFISRLEYDMKNSIAIRGRNKPKKGSPIRSIINFNGLLRILTTSKTEKGKEFQKCS